MAGSNGATYIDVLPNMNRYFREARAELRANRVTGQIDVEVERASLARAEQRLQQTADRTVAARNRQINAAQAQARAERDLQAMQGASNISSERYADQVERVARAQREATIAARARNRAESDLDSARNDVNTIRVRIDTAEAEQQHRGFMERITRQVAHITARIDLATAPYRAALRMATRPVTQIVKLSLGGSLSTKMAGLLGSVGKLVGLMGAASLAAGALAPPIAGAAMAVGQLAGLIALLPAGIMAAGAAFAAIKIGTSGIGDAFKALAKPAAGSGSAASQAASQAKAVANAEKQLTQAQKGAERAQKTLNDERFLAVRRLRDMRFEVAQSSRDERGAILDLNAARKALTELGRDGSPVSQDERDRAQLDVENAEANVERIKAANADLVADNDAAQKAGVEGDKQVVAARESVADATDSVAEAQANLVEAMNAGALAAAGAADAGAEAMAKLSANAQDLVTKVRGLEPAWKELKNSVQDAFTFGMGDAIVNLSNNLLPTLKTGLTGIATELNTGILASLDVLSTDSAAMRLGMVMENTATATGNIAAGFRPFVDGFLSVAATGATFLPQLTAGFAGVGEKFQAWAADGEKVSAFIEKALTAASQFGEIFANLGGIIGDVFTATGASGGGFLETLVTITEAIHSFTSSVEGQTALQSFFTSVATVVSTLAPLILQIAEIIGTTVAPAIADFVEAAGPGVSELIKGLGEGLKALAPALGPLGEVVSVIGKALGPALGPLGEAIGAIVTALAPILGFMAEYIGLVVQELAPAFTELANALAPVIQQLIEQLRPYLPMIAEVIGTIARALGDALLQAITALAPMIPVIVDAFIQVLQALVPLIPVILDLAVQLIELLIPAIPVLAAFMTDVLVPAINLLMPVIQWLADVIIWLADKAIEYMRPMWEQMIAQFGRAKEQMDNVRRWFSELGDKIREFVDNAKEKFDAFVAFVKDIPNKVREFLSDAGEWLKDTGKKIIEGLINGIKDKFNDVKETLGNLTDKLTSWKGPEARDAILLTDAGRTIIDGLIKGLESKYGDVKASLQGLTSDIAATSFDAPIAPTLAPVDPAQAASAVDPSATASVMSDALGQVSTGAAALNTAFGSATALSSTSWAGLASSIAGNKAGLIDPAFAGIVGNLNTAKASFINAGNIITPVWNDTAAKIKAAQTGTVTPALDNMQAGAMNTANTYGTAAGLLEQKWSSVREGTAAPVRWSIANVFNDGVVGSWNSVSDLLGTTKIGTYPIRFATGGEVPVEGFAAGRDSVPALLMPGEFVLRKAVVDRLGIPNLHKINQGADPQGAFPNMSFNDVAARYQGGGLATGTPAWEQLKRGADWARSRNGRPYVLGGSANGAGGTDCSGYMSGIANVIGGGDGTRQWATMAFNGGGNSQYATGPQSFVAGLSSGFSIGVLNGGPAGGHTAGTIGGVEGIPAVNVESGGSHGNVAFGGPAVGADHPQFPTKYHLPLVNDAFVSGGSGGGSMISPAQMIASMTDPIWKSVSDKVGATSFGGMTAPIPAGYQKAMQKAVTDKSVELAQSIMSTDPGGADVERWRPMAIRAMNWVGRGLRPDVPAQVDAMLKQIGSESGGNPGIAQQIVDVNGTGEAAGVGLLQIIPGTWAANRDPALPDDRRDPFANMVGALRYYTGRYGSDLTTMWGQGHGYDQGGIARGIGLMPKYTIEPERVLDPHETRLYDSLLPILHSVNDSVSYAAPGISDRDRAALETVGGAGGQFVGQQIENQYVVDPNENARVVRRATKRAFAGSVVK